MKKSARFSLLAIALLIMTQSCVLASFTHEGPDPISHWVFNRRSVSQGEVDSQLGPNGKITGKYKVGFEHGILLDSNDASILLSNDIASVKKFLPTQEFTISAWVSINQRQKWGGIIGALQDNGGFEKGWIVGYNQRNFYFGLSTTGADDGDGHMTYLSGDTDYELGKFYHVVVVYDGKKMQLFVNGKLDAESTVQSGDILYPKAAPYMIGAYRDDDEANPHYGRIRDIAVYDSVAKPKWVAKEFEHNEALAKAAMNDVKPEELAIVVDPFLHMATQTSIVVGWQTSVPGTTIVRYGETDQVEGAATGTGGKFVHHVKLEKLKPNTQYFYQVETFSGKGKSVKSEVLTFQTAPSAETPFAFAIISDTQSNPKVAKQVAELAWGQRPSFLIHPGDLVGTGTNDRHWTQQFFPAMAPLIGRVPIYPVLGNHEVNAKNYYDYFQLPDPEYYYEFKYGNAHFFMIDTNKKVDPESEQYKWLDAALAKSTAKWKFVVHHHPPYSSDENDYGNLWKVNKSSRGDARVRELCTLYDKHGVDIVWNGHIHSYERTWPIFDNKVIEDKGTIYMITGGGGGSLETAGPFRNEFENTVKRGHHYCMVYINHGTLEFKAFDLDGQLFDTMKLEKK